MINPHVDIGPGYLHRWHLIPRNPFFNIYLHKFIRGDLGRDLHDHPWWSMSICFAGTLYESTTDVETSGLVQRWMPVFRHPEHAHRIDVIRGPAWTLFITGPRVRQWGFYTPEGWQHWREYLGVDNE